jgi:DNA polymerase III delta prime subunit
MDKINLNKILHRERDAQQVKDILRDFELNKNNLLFKKGIYVYGDPGTGKSSFVINILKELDYDIIKYDAGDVRNTSVIDDITKHNMSDKNIMSMFNKKVKKIAIVMDEIDGMNSGDKGGINSLIKLIRPKKTKKQRNEDVTMNPIICIGNYRVDKKIKELMKVCHSIELKPLNKPQVLSIIESLFQKIKADVKEKLVEYIQGDLRKLNNMNHLYNKNPECFTYKMISDIFQIKSYNDDTKKITNKLLKSSYSINEHNNIMNETDRTSVGLLWHENIIDAIEKMDKKISIPFYISQLENICFADYIDRVTFQKQIWQFNEMSSLIKTLRNNQLYHKAYKKEFMSSNTQDNTNNSKFSPQEIRFTKVLTKYSTEYNNSLFIQKLCQKLGMDKKDLFGYFIELKDKYEDNEIIHLLDNYEINKLDINRIYRYIEKYIKENATGTSDTVIDIDDDDNYDNYDNDGNEC